MLMEQDKTRQTIVTGQRQQKNFLWHSKCGRIVCGVFTFAASR